MTEYEIYLPLSFNDGSSIPEALVRQTKQQLVDHFGGLTDFRQRNAGIWRMGSVTYHDEILILRVLADSEETSRAFFTGLKENLRKTLDQEDVLIVERAVRVV